MLWPIQKSRKAPNIAMLIALFATKRFIPETCAPRARASARIAPCPASQRHHGLYPGRSRVARWNELKLLPACLQERLAAADANLLQRLQAIRDEGGTHHREPLDSPRRELGQHLVRVGGNPPAS